MTRRNDRDLAVANRDTWTITAIGPDGTLNIQGDGPTGARSRTLPAAYVQEHVELAYATTVHGTQGETTYTGHLVLGEHTTAAYVAMTARPRKQPGPPGRRQPRHARRLWIETFGRPRRPRTRPRRPTRSRTPRPLRPHRPRTPR
jgi:hypothetical protein